MTDCHVAHSLGATPQYDHLNPWYLVNTLVVHIKRQLTGEFSLLELIIRIKALSDAQNPLSNTNYNWNQRSVQQRLESRSQH